MMLPQACPLFKTIASKIAAKNLLAPGLVRSTWIFIYPRGLGRNVDQCGSMWINVDQCGLMWINTIQYTYFMKPFTDRYILFVS